MPGALVTVWFLELRSAGDLRPAGRIDGAELAVTADGRLSRWLYEEVGGPYAWLDHRDHDDAWWERRARTRVTLLLFAGDALAGYAELAPAPDGTVDIDYFGLRPGFQGRGLGGDLLTRAILHAFGPLQARRVTVNTCSLDHLAALRNYRARGFEVVAERQELRPAPDLPPQAIVSTVVTAGPGAVWEALIQDPGLTRGTIVARRSAEHLALDRAEGDGPARTQATLDVIALTPRRTAVVVRHTGWGAPDDGAARAERWAHDLHRLRVRLAEAGTPAP